MLEIRKVNDATYVAKVTDKNNLSYYFPLTVTDEEIKIQSVRALYDWWESLQEEWELTDDDIEFFCLLFKDNELKKIVVTSDWDADHLDTAKEKFLYHYYSPLLTAEEAEQIINNN